MPLDRVLAMTGIADWIADPFFYAEAGAAGLSAFLFLCCLALCIMAFRSAGAAKNAHREAKDLAIEVRRLTAQVEKATSRRASSIDDAALELSEADQADPEFAPNAERTLEDAKSAATVPSALLGRRSRRRL
jgi:hypothetical protein